MEIYDKDIEFLGWDEEIHAFPTIRREYLSPLELKIQERSGLLKTI